jgi:hypothetical protein
MSLVFRIPPSPAEVAFCRHVFLVAISLVAQKAVIGSPSSGTALPSSLILGKAREDRVRGYAAVRVALSYARWYELFLLRNRPFEYGNDGCKKDYLSSSRTCS